MIERPILFSAPMILAILAGNKTQTRRVMRPQPEPSAEFPAVYWWWKSKIDDALSLDDAEYRGPYGKPGDQLWVRETWRRDSTKAGKAAYRAGSPAIPLAWTPSIHMPRWASRIQLEVVDVRVQRLQDISEDDARAEGVKVGEPVPARIVVTDIDGTVTKGRGTSVDFTARGAFCHLWDGINAKRGYDWASNPWVWVVEFRRIERALPSLKDVAVKGYEEAKRKGWR